MKTPDHSTRVKVAKLANSTQLSVLHYFEGLPQRKITVACIEAALVELGMPLRKTSAK
jgi:hypothetical protein